MKDLLKVALAMTLLFASTFVIMQSTGLVTDAGVATFLERAHNIHPAWLGAIVIALLLLDLLIAVPTMTTILLAGYFMGPLLGGIAAAFGLMLLGVTGYGLGRRLGRPALNRLFKDEQRLTGIEAAFSRNDLLVLFTCQALPILPELSCTLAGISRMRFARFLLGYAVGVVPFAFIVAYAGSISTLSNPGPAIYTAIGVSVLLLLCWTVVQRRSA
jgi:uncharacterized membrane protein YdjX (TVP38/TMEM64 family)